MRTKATERSISSPREGGRHGRGEEERGATFGAMTPKILGCRCKGFIRIALQESEMFGRQAYHLGHFALYTSINGHTRPAGGQSTHTIS